MPNCFQDLDFPCDSVDIGGISDFAFVEDLDSHFFSGEGVRGELDFSESAFAEGFGYGLWGAIVRGRSVVPNR
jgi:hypothetical protein